MKYKIIYPDPPWRFKNWSINELTTRGEKWARRNGRSPYPVMTTDDICNLPVQKIAHPHSLCLMWCTWPKLQDGLRVLDAWGFEYVTKAFVWVKLNPSGIGWHFGLGYHTHGNTEFVLIGKRGKGTKRVDKGISELIIYPRGLHSRKPPTTMTRIERLYGNVPRIELFARQQFSGWACWGNEVEPSIGTEPLHPYISPPYKAIIDEDEYHGLPVVDTVFSYEPGEQMRMM